MAITVTANIQRICNDLEFLIILEKLIFFRIFQVTQLKLCYDVLLRTPFLQINNLLIRNSNIKCPYKELVYFGSVELVWHYQSTSSRGDTAG